MLRQDIQTYFPVVLTGNKLPKYHWVLALICAGVFALLMPREELFPYHFQVGQPWSYRSLYAPFDFEVMYPDEQVRSEVERVNSEHAPYFLLDPEVARRQKKQFARLVSEQAQLSKHDTQFDDLVHNQAAYIAFGNQLLDIIYNNGIADPGEEAFRDNPGFVYVVTPLSERKVPVKEVGTIHQAKDFLTDTLPFCPLRQPELILPLLEKSLTVNMRYSDSLGQAGKRRKLAAVAGTGIIVRQGEPVAQPGEILTTETVQKLQSLERRYHSDDAPLYPLGSGLLALLVFFVLLAVFYQKKVEITEVSYPVAAILTLSLSLAAGWLGRVGEAAPLLIPFWVLPFFLGREAGKFVWIAVLLLTTYACPWPAGWLFLQSAGWLITSLWLDQQPSWRGKMWLATITYVIQMLVLAGLTWSEKLPHSMYWTDAATFLGLAAGISLATYPFQNWAMSEKQFNP